MAPVTAFDPIASKNSTSPYRAFDPEPTKCMGSTVVLQKCRAWRRATCAPQQPHFLHVTATMAAYRPRPVWFSSSRRAQVV